MGFDRGGKQQSREWERAAVNLEPGRHWNGKVPRECGSSVAGQLWECSVPGEAAPPHILAPLHLLPALPGLCHGACAGTRCCRAQEMWDNLQGLLRRTPALPQGFIPRIHVPKAHTQNAWVCIQHKWRLKSMPAQRECAAFCWLSQLVSQFPQKPAVCRRGWSSQAIRSKKTLSASLLFSSIYNYCVRELHNL